MEYIDFNRPHYGKRELAYIEEAVSEAHISASGPFTQRCRSWLEDRTGAVAALLVNSCTAALEMSAMLIGIKPGDEAIMPSYTFPSTANAFVLRGAVPVFVDIRPDTLNIDTSQIESAITERTRAIVPVHYAGVGCDMDEICAIADKHRLSVIEDAAQGLMSAYRGRPLGSIAPLGALSFHETKNVTCGEGGALLVNDAELSKRAEVLRDKGTNRSSFFRGEVDKYSWVDIGSSFALSDLNAAFLWAQLHEAEALTNARLAIWSQYHDRFAELERRGMIRRPVVPEHCVHNAHMYYLLMPDLEARTRMLSELEKSGINATFHYVPLHSSPAGQRFGRACGSLPHTDQVGDRLLRLPLWVDMSQDMIDRIADAVCAIAQ